MLWFCQEFRWHPVVNESMLDVYKAWLSMASEQRPKLIITGSATVSQPVTRCCLTSLQQISIYMYCPVKAVGCVLAYINW